MCKLKKALRRKIILALIFSPIFVLGCDESNSLNTEYGAISGVRGGDSLNGTRYFSEMFAAQGAVVKRSSVINPKIDQYNTLVWFPDSDAVPSAQAISRLSDWLDSGYQRTLIYVAGGSRTTEDYLRTTIGKVPVDQKEEYLRRISEEIISDYNNDFGSRWIGVNFGPGTCDWFDVADKRIGKKKAVSGLLLAEEKTYPEMELDFSYDLTPRKEWQPKELLFAADKPFIFSMSDPSARHSESELILVTQGSILLNYSLIDEDKQDLAAALIRRCDTSQGVLFLESGSDGIEVRESSISNHSQWSWIAQPPLCYIVPHVLFLGVVFCFVYFPIFGRPKRITQRSTSTFRNHISATAELLARSNQPNRAINKIRDYQRAVSGDTNRNKSD
jgi:hypothetical protein